MPYGTPGGPKAAPFSITFDYEDNHCSRGRDYALDALTDTSLCERITALLSPQMNDDQVSYLLEQQAQQLRRDLEDISADEHPAEHARLVEHVDQLDEAAKCLTFCEYDCDCAQHAFRVAEHAIDEALNGIGDQVWAVTEITGDQRDTGDDVEGPLELNDVESIAFLRSWSYVSVTWDGRNLVIERSGRQGFRKLEFKALTKDERALYERWNEQWYDMCAASIIVTHGTAAAAFAMDVCDIEFGVDDVERLTASYAKLDPDDQRRLDRTVTRALLPDWAGSHDELLRCVLSATTAAPAA